MDWALHNIAQLHWVEAWCYTEWPRRVWCIYETYVSTLKQAEGEKGRRYGKCCVARILIHSTSALTWDACLHHANDWAQGLQRSAVCPMKVVKPHMAADCMCSLRILLVPVLDGPDEPKPYFFDIYTYDPSQREAIGITEGFIAADGTGPKQARRKRHRESRFPFELIMKAFDLTSDNCCEFLRCMSARPRL